MIHSLYIHEISQLNFSASNPKISRYHKPVRLKKMADFAFDNPLIERLVLVLASEVETNMRVYMRRIIILVDSILRKR